MRDKIFKFTLMFALLSSVILLSLGLVAPGFRTDIKISENGFAYEINNVLRHKNISEMDYSPARSLIFILLPSLSDKIKRAAPNYFTDPIYKGSFSMLSAILLLLNGSKGEMCIGYMLVLFLVLFPILKFQTLFNMLIFERANRYEKIIISISRFSMIDIFILFLTLMMSKLISYTRVEFYWGFYSYCLAIFLSIILGYMLEFKRTA